MSFDLSTLTDEQKDKLALKVKSMKDFKLPKLDSFYSDTCTRHSELVNECRQCGISLRKHQRVAAAWLYLARRGLLADPCGSGKSFCSGALIALIDQMGELSRGEKIIIVCRPPAVAQWQEELQRVLRTKNIVISQGPKKKRTELYTSSNWDILIIGYQMAGQDIITLENFNTRLLVIDDVDALKNRVNQTAFNLRKLARGSSRVAVLTATPLQKRLAELYSILELVGGFEILGTEKQFERDYIACKKPIRYKNLDRFKDRINHMTLRRSFADIDDAEVPELIPNNVILELYPPQRAAYEELRQGVLRLIREQGEDVKRVEAVAKFNYGQQICAGMPTLGFPDGPGMSVKLDWFMNKLDGDFDEDKVVCFCLNKNTIRAVQSRLEQQGIGYTTIWGEKPKPADRLASQKQFWQDPNCKVLLGTTAIEQSINLQVARHIVNIDTILNPARMTQLAGRIKRVGSSHRTVYAHNLFTADTQEARYLQLLDREQALSNHIFEDSSDLYEGLSGMDLLLLIGGSSIGQR